MEPLHYVPIPWTKDGWRYDLPQYQTAKVLAGGDIEIAAYGVGAGEFTKNNALVFIAPKEGRYALSCTIDVFRWEGDGGYRLALFRKEVRSGSLRFTPISIQPLELKKGIPVKVEGIDLRKGSELVILPWLDGNYTGGSVTFKGLLPELHQRHRQVEVAPVRHPRHRCLHRLPRPVHLWQLGQGTLPPLGARNQGRRDQGAQRGVDAALYQLGPIGRGSGAPYTFGFAKI